MLRIAKITHIFYLIICNMFSIHFTACPSNSLPARNRTALRPSVRNLCRFSMTRPEPRPSALISGQEALASETGELIWHLDALVPTSALYAALSQDQPRWYFEHFLYFLTVLNQAFPRPGAQSLAAVSLSSASFSAGSTLGRPAPAKDMMQSENIWNLCTKP